MVLSVVFAFNPRGDNICASFTNEYKSRQKNTSFLQKLYFSGVKSGGAISLIGADNGPARGASAEGQILGDGNGTVPDESTKGELRGGKLLEWKSATEDD